MKPLSSFTFIKGNLKKVLPIFISTILSVFLIYIFSLIIISDRTMSDKLNTNVVKRNSMLISTNNNSEGISKELIDIINGDDNVKAIIPVNYDNNNLAFRGIIGSASIDFINIFREDLNILIDSWKIEITEGAFPKQGSREVLLPEEFAKANKIKVGDLLKKGKDSIKRLNADYTVVGIYKGEIFAPITCYVGDVSKDELSKYGIMYFLKNTEDYKINKIVEEEMSKNLQLFQYEEIKKLMDKIYSGIWFLYEAFSIIIIIVVAVSLSNLNHLSFLQRINEFKLYHSIGISKNKLRLKVLKENSLVATFGAIVGLIFTVLIGEVLNILVFEAKAQQLLFISKEGIVLVALVIILAPLISSISTFRAIGKCEYID